MRPIKKLDDDELLLTMHRQGKTLTEISQRFKCSTVAVHKRLKRLLSTVKVAEVLSEHGLTGQQAEYALLRGQGLKPKQAALQVCDTTSDDSTRNRASQLENNENVRAAVLKLLDLHLPAAHRVKTLRSLVDSKLPDIQIRALDQSWKLDGSYSPERSVNINVDGAFIVNAAIEELTQRIINRQELDDVNDFKKNIAGKNEGRVIKIGDGNGRNPD